jgi:hypothetical protein
MMGIPIFWMLIVIAILLLVGVRKLYAIANNTELSRELEKHESQINELRKITSQKGLIIVQEF